MPLATARSLKSTNVRVNNNRIAAFRLLFSVTNVFPSLAALLAERLFFTPPPARRKPPLGATAHRLRAAGGEELAAWSWGEGPGVLLLHGWGGSSAQLEGLVPALVARGFRVVAVDAPGHGLSGGRMSSMPEFARAAHEAARRLGPFCAVVGHSMGGAALALALRDGLAAERAVFVGTPGSPVDWIRRFADALGVGPRALDGMKARSERRLGFRWEELDVASIAPRMRVPLLVVHDVDDREVPFAEGEAVARVWPGARVLATRGLGHNRILSDPAIAARVAAFAAGEELEDGGFRVPPCASASLSQRPRIR
jgi:pimeloyl-ACP methyl ester carboxylesterase